MKVAQLVSKRFKETPADCQIISQALMMRGGYMKQMCIRDRSYRLRKWPPSRM